MDNLFLAWQEFKKSKTNKFDVQQFEYTLEDNIFQLRRQLKNKTYQHAPYLSFYIKDPKLRHIHKASVMDRVLHHAVFRILYPVFDRGFIFDSYSCRLNKGAYRAVNRLQGFARKVSKNHTKTCFCLKCDIKRFFDSIDHNILLGLTQKKIQDMNAVWLIQRIIKSFSAAPSRGLPLGNITSQLFANIYLNELDRFIKHKLRISPYIRYCDDFVILSTNKDSLKNLILKINIFLRNKLGLLLHPNKVEIRKYHQGLDFLGYVSFPRHRILRNKTKKRMLRRIEQSIEGLIWGELSEESFIQTLQSYLGILKHCKSRKIKQEVAKILTERIK